jgi:S-adenosylmethionine hydrolase
MLTDFGLADTYVGQVKGAILAIAPGAVVVDLTHAVPAYDVVSGAFLLWSAVEAFGAGSIHVAVVDPGVGSVRRAIAVATGRGDILIGPDNGVLMPAAQRLGGVARALELNEPAYWRVALPSASFHGRDIFGPVAAHVASGVPLARLGSPASDLVQLGLPSPHGPHGEVVHVDTFGNLVTNLPGTDLPSRFQVVIGQLTVPGHAYYAAVKPGRLLALVGSSGLLEISVRDGNAAEATGARRGTPVIVEPL